MAHLWMLRVSLCSDRKFHMAERNVGHMWWRQASTIGSASYVVNAADLTTVTPGNVMFKYADDTYIIIPVRNTQSRDNELDSASKWALANSLWPNKAKCVQIIFTGSRHKVQICQPPTMTVLLIHILSEKADMTVH